MNGGSNGAHVVVSQGDPDGVGPELLLRLAAEGHLVPGDRVVAGRARLQRLVDSIDAPWAAPGLAALDPLLDGDPAPEAVGQVAALERAVDLVVADGGALVTAPIDKAVAGAEGFAHIGHTEYLAARCGTDVAMLMAGDSIRVALVTIHAAIVDVPSLVTRPRIVTAGRLLAGALREWFRVEHPSIGVLGLNPHAGESGVLGSEEAATIVPAIEDLRAADGRATFAGPLPADTAFFHHLKRRYDGLVAMYHDQGLAPFKLLHFTSGINVTLGLPFCRTSPDHGTAKDIAGRGVADPSSMIAAVRFARETGS